MLWHQRLGHPSPLCPTLVHKYNSSISKCAQFSCIHFTMAKCHKLPFYRIELLVLLNCCIWISRVQILYLLYLDKDITPSIIFYLSIFPFLDVPKRLSILKSQSTKFVCSQRYCLYIAINISENRK